VTQKKTFRSAVAKDVLQYVALKRTLGRNFENATRVLLNLDGFLAGLGKPLRDLTLETFSKWSQTLQSLSSNTKLARMQVERNFCIYPSALSKTDPPVLSKNDPGFPTRRSFTLTRIP
jgi:hypothetical protein